MQLPTPPESFTFGDGIDWSSPLSEVHLYVELPFWLMVAPGPVVVRWSDTDFAVDILPPWREVFLDGVTDSRATRFAIGPWSPARYRPPAAIVSPDEAQGMPLMERRCKTVLSLTARGHEDAFRELTDSDPPIRREEHRVYWASLCEAHIPVVSELIQRYRLATYDRFAYEVSAWDVPVWWIKRAGVGHNVVLAPYKSWDQPPVVVKPGDPVVRQPIEWTTTQHLEGSSSSDATPGEFELLDARSLFERGDYTGAVRRAVTAIEAVLGWALLLELEKTEAPDDARRGLANTDGDFPGRLRQWRKLADPSIRQAEFDAFEVTRTLRHEIVHQGRRLSYGDRHLAEKYVDTGRWLYNKIENKPARRGLRERGLVLKAVGAATLAPHFSSYLDADGITLGPLAGLSRP